jgi:hypothetical protein
VLCRSVDCDVAAFVSALEDRGRLIAVMQCGVVKAGRLARPAAPVPGVGG